MLFLFVIFLIDICRDSIIFKYVYIVSLDNELISCFIFILLKINIEKKYRYLNFSYKLSSFKEKK